MMTCNVVTDRDKSTKKLPLLQQFKMLLVAYGDLQYCHR